MSWSCLVLTFSLLSAIKFMVEGALENQMLSLISHPLQPLFNHLYGVLPESVGLSLVVVDLVTLSGHSIGVSHCSSLLERHVNFSKTGMPDPTLDLHFAQKFITYFPYFPIKPNIK